AYDFIIDSAVKLSNVTTPEGKREVLAETLPILSQIENEVIKEHYLKKLASVLDTSFESVLKQSEKNKTTAKPAPVVPEKQTKSREEITELYLLALLIQGQDSTSQITTIQPILQN